MILHLFGGSFDPPHRGHLAVVKYFSAESDLVLVSPLNISQDKSPVAPADLRLHMCELVFQGLRNVQVTGIDIERQGITYTIDTVRDIKSAFPNADIHVVIGADGLSSLGDWKDIDELKSQVVFDVVARNGFTLPQTLDATFELHQIVTPDISSSQIRRALQNFQGETSMLDSLTTKEVANFIIKNRLYHI